MALLVHPERLQNNVKTLLDKQQQQPKITQMNVSLEPVLYG